MGMPLVDEASAEGEAAENLERSNEEGGDDQDAPIDEGEDEEGDDDGDEDDEEEDDEFRDTFQDLEQEWMDPSEDRVLTQVFAATEEGNAAALSELLGRLSVSPDTLGEDGDTALHLACLYGQTECVRLLLGAGSCATTTDEDGGTPLHDASAGGFMEIVMMLLDAGAKEAVNIPDADGETPLHTAARGEHAEVVTLLLENGADPSVENNSGRTPEQEARGCPGVQEILRNAAEVAGAEALAGPEDEPQQE